MFFTLDSNTQLTKKFIKSVTYHLHPTYKINKIKISEPPFLLSRTAYGWFNIECYIEFQPWTKFKVMKVDHMLSFNKGGKSYTHLLETVDMTPTPGMKSKAKGDEPTPSDY